MQKKNCPKCALTQRFCICLQLHRNSNSIPVHFLVHIKEFSKSSNSARLASLCVENTKIFLYGVYHQPMEWEKLLVGTNPMILFPATTLKLEDACAKVPYPDPLIIPDGNWSQASKMAYKLKRLFPHLPFVTFPYNGENSVYRLREHPNPAYLSTFESMAMSLRVFQGQESYQKHMENFHIFVKNSLHMRGCLQN